MLKAKPFLAIDFGAGTLKIAEFEINEAGALTLRQFGQQALGLEGAQESARERVVTKALQDLLAARGFTARQANVCAPGFQVFSKFVKLPPVDTAKVTQIIQYEAQQNVPFPLADVVWDYQILGTAPGGELDVLLVAIKTDLVEGLFRVAEARGLRLNVVDASPAALCNAFRFNYGDLEGCSMLLDIGAKTSNVLFFEKGKVFARSISIGANTITQDFATETKTRFAEAEAFKIEHGFVSLGGAYEEPDDPKQAAVAKVARQVMTRLHIQLNQTVQFYRGQQGGGAPQRLFLSGGASIMPYASQFFGEKLNVPVEYFNPLRNIQLGPEVNVDELTTVAHAYGEVVGVALRNLAQCPVELNLMPKSSRQRQQLAEEALPAGRHVQPRRGGGGLRLVQPAPRQRQGGRPDGAVRQGVAPLPARLRPGPGDRPAEGGGEAGRAARGLAGGPVLHPRPVLGTAPRLRLRRGQGRLHRPRHGGLGGEPADGRGVRRGRGRGGGAGGPVGTHDVH
ncbi:MAG TPA: pilus assembly protein PilM [Verrucomicrobiota bacterium]|nr:pilus assembly protein PilM [Verrucomicrobiota bacterium]